MPYALYPEPTSFQKEVIYFSDSEKNGFEVVPRPSAPHPAHAAAHPAHAAANTATIFTAADRDNQAISGPPITRSHGGYGMRPIKAPVTRMAIFWPDFLS